MQRFILLSFEFSGIKNIQKKISLKFYKSKVGKNINLHHANIKGIYGENGVGKSAIVSAMYILKPIVLRQNYLLDPKVVSFLNNLINKITEKAEFSCLFLVENNNRKDIYRYSVSINKKNARFIISKEQLERKKISSKEFRTVYTANEGNLELKEKSGLFSEKVLQRKTTNLLTASSFPSLYLQLDSDFPNEKKTEFDYALQNTLFFFFNIMVYLESADLHDNYYVNEVTQQIQSKKELGKKDLAPFISTMYSLLFNDRIVEKKEYKKFETKVQGMTRFIQLFKSDLRQVDIDLKEMGDNYKCSLIFNYGNFSIDSDFESTGVKKLMELYSYFYDLNKGAIVFIDELDANLHDVYLYKLLEYVSEYAEGQLCFTSHNLGPMELLSKQNYGLDFLTRNQNIISWVKNGNYSAAKQYRSGRTKGSPFNIEAFDFLKVFGTADE